jgi:hypothetical protein
VWPSNHPYKTAYGSYSLVSSYGNSGRKGIEESSRTFNMIGNTTRPEAAPI